MNYDQNWKRVLLLTPQTQATNATVSARVDTLGFAKCRISLLTIQAATNPNTVFKLTEGDTTVYSNASAIVAFTGTTNTVTDATNGYLIPADITTVGRVQTEFDVECRGRKRHLFVTLQCGASNSTCAVIADLTRATEMPNNDTERNVGVSVTG